MGCSATARLAAQLNLTKEELEQLKKDIRSSTELRIQLEGDLIRVRNSATLLTSDNEKLKHDLILKSGDGGMDASVFESAKEEQERFQEWILMEIKEGNVLLTSILKMRGSDETGAHDEEMKKHMDLLEENEFNNEKLKEFSQWKYKVMRQELEGLMDDRATWVRYLSSYEEEIKVTSDNIDRESGGKVRPQLGEIKSKMSRLPSAAQPLPRLKAIRELDKTLASLRINSTSEVDSDTKTMIGKQAEEIKVLTQRLAAQRKLEEDRKASAEKELSLKEVHIKHLENKVKDLSRPVVADTEIKAKDKELEKMKAEVIRIREAKQIALDEANNLNRDNEDLAEQLRVKQEEIERLRTT